MAYLFWYELHWNPGNRIVFFSGTHKNNTKDLRIVQSRHSFTELRNQEWMVAPSGSRVLIVRHWIRRPTYDKELSIIFLVSSNVIFSLGSLMAPSLASLAPGTGMFFHETITSSCINAVFLWLNSKTLAVSLYVYFYVYRVSLYGYWNQNLEIRYLFNWQYGNEIRRLRCEINGNLNLKFFVTYLNSS